MQAEQVLLIILGNLSRFIKRHTLSLKKRNEQKESTA